MKAIISGLKAKLSPAHPDFGDRVPFKDMGMLDHIEKIVEITKKSGIGKCRTAGKRHLGYVAEKLGISPIQAMLFSLFMEKSDDQRIMISEIAESIQCSKVRIIKYMSECEELEKKKLIRCSRSDDCTSYRIPRDVRESLRKFNEYRPQKNDNLSISKFFVVMETIFHERSNCELTYEGMKQELLELISQNMQLLFCKKIMSYKLRDGQLVLLLCFCHLFGNNNDDNIGSHDIEFIYEEKFIFCDVENSLCDGSHELIKAKFIEYANDDGFVNSESWKLSDTAKKDLLSELNIRNNESYKKNLVLHDSIKIKEMFYNPREAGEIEKLVSLLQEDNFRKIQDRLDVRGMRKGFACLFSGAPGTGKTETAHQIARLTKRNIMAVDISETKSMWFGESEKKIKKVFDTYRAAVENSKIAPILLFNEADAVIGKRKEFNASSRAVDQTENTIQNIILQEMENLSGILIATTNLTQNMDNAFERRFLYKIVFEKPSPESRKNIWKTLLPDLPDMGAGELSARFGLSGGQIENIARKTEVDAIIGGGGLSVDILAQYCRDEALQNSGSSAKIGFCR